MAALTDPEATELAQAATTWGMDVLVEVHNQPELDRALALPATPGTMIGVNNRDLSTLKVDIATTETLAQKIPSNRLLVAESGLARPADLARMAAAGARCFLIGTSFMRRPDVTTAVRDMLTPPAAIAAS